MTARYTSEQMPGWLVLVVGVVFGGLLLLTMISAVYGAATDLFSDRISLPRDQWECVQAGRPLHGTRDRHVDGSWSEECVLWGRRAQDGLAN